MKKYLIVICGASLLLASCIKQVDKIYTGDSKVEIDAAPLNSNAVGVSFPIFTRHMPAGRPISTSVDSTIRRIGNSINIRLNLVGKQSAKEETVGYKIVSSPITSISFPATISGQVPSMGSGTLTVSDAVAGTHFTALSGKAVIPANSSFGFITIPILNAGASAGQARYIGIKLDSTGTLLPSVNYMQIGVVIDQR